MATTFKSYSEKSKARRALVQVYGMDKDATDAYLSTVEGKHGFYLTEDNKPLSTADVELGVNAASDAGFSASRTIEAAALPTEADVQALAPQVDEQAAAEGAALAAAVVEQHEADTAPAPSASAFGAFAMSQLTAPSNAAPAEPQRTSTSQRVAGLKIEKNREERNGVKMPSVGGMCRAVWDALNNMMTHDEATGLANVPTVADIKKLAETNGWNVNNASIEYYQWRKWHGITGRGKKTI